VSLDFFLNLSLWFPFF
jgi:hypothetical protein